MGAYPDTSVSENEKLRLQEAEFENLILGDQKSCWLGILSSRIMGTNGHFVQQLTFASLLACSKEICNDFACVLM